MSKSLIVLILFLVFIVSSCDNAKAVKMGVYSVTVDSCEYVIARIDKGIGIVHKQNCKYCENRYHGVEQITIE